MDRFAASEFVIYHWSFIICHFQNSRGAAMTADIVIYQKPTCTTCRQTIQALKEAGVDYESVDYYLDPIPKRKLKELLSKMKLAAKDILRTKEPIYQELKLAEKKLSEDELIDLMVEHPDLIQRPIVERGERAILARPAERIKEIL
jgi:arsenate reductase